MSLPVIAVFGDKTKRYVEQRQYYRIMQDDELDDYTRPSDGELSGKPAVMRREPHHYVLLNEAFQWMWYHLNNPVGVTEAVWKKKWLAYTEASKAFCNQGPIYNADEDKYVARDYINNKGIGLRLPKKSTLGCVNNVYCGTEVKLTERQGPLLIGSWALKVETIREPIEGLTFKSHPHLIHKACIIMDVPASETDSLRKINPFPDFGGRNTGIDVYYPVLSNRDAYYPLDQLEKLPLGKALPPVWRPK